MVDFKRPRFWLAASLVLVCIGVTLVLGASRWGSTGPKALGMWDIAGLVGFFLLVVTSVLFTAGIARTRIFSRRQSLAWVVSTMFCGCLVIAFLIAEREITADREYAAGMSDSFPYNVMSAGGAVSFQALIVLGCIAFVSVLLNWSNRKLGCTLEFFSLIVVGFVIAASYCLITEVYRSRSAISANMLLTTKRVGEAMGEYVDKYEQFPPANNWCKAVTRERSIGIAEDEFDIGQLPDIECVVAFNHNLGGLRRDGIEGNVVLLFESEGELNLSGGPELIAKPRSKDRHFVFERDLYIYVVFVDGVVGRYRLHDGAVALYDPEKEEFTEYVEKGSTRYSPLKWR
jgi:hypothetical protein